MLESLQLYSLFIEQQLTKLKWGSPEVLFVNNNRNLRVIVDEDKKIFSIYVVVIDEKEEKNSIFKSLISDIDVSFNIDKNDLSDDLKDDFYIIESVVTPSGDKTKKRHSYILTKDEFAFLRSDVKRYDDYPFLMTPLQYAKKQYLENWEKFEVFRDQFNKNNFY